MRPVALVALALVLLTACGERSSDVPSSECLSAVAPAPDGAWVTAIRPNPAAGTLELILAEGRTLPVPAQPEALVSTLPGLTETLLYLGGGAHLVAATEHCDLPTALEDLPRVGVMPLAHEVLVGLGPDLVLVDGVLLPDAERALRRHGLAVLPLQSRSVAHFRTTVAVLAAVLGTPEARERAALFERQLDRAVQAANPRPGQAPPRVLLVAQADPLFVLGPGSLLDDMVRICGGVNIACDLGRASGPFSEELVLARRPDVVLVLGGDLPPSVAARWSGLPASVGDRIVSLDEDLFLRAGPRTPEALEELSYLIHAAGGDEGGR